MKSVSLVLLALAALLVSGRAAVAADPPAAPAPAAARLPTLFLIGDSTVNNSTKGLQGWGKPFIKLFDPAKITVVNRARGGRSSRTFLTEGLWDAVLADMKPGDFVLMQFGHNDGGSPRTSYRASLKGNGDETQGVVNPQTKKMETIHTYGWYLRQFIAGAKAKGATPIVLSMIPRNDWGTDGKVLRADTGYGLWAKQAAEQGGAQFINLNGIIADKYDALGQDKVKTFFPFEHTHTSPEGAALNAECVAEGLRELPNCPLKDDLLPTAGAAK